MKSGYNHSKGALAVSGKAEPRIGRAIKGQVKEPVHGSAYRRRAFWPFTIVRSAFFVALMFAQIWGQVHGT